MLRTPVRSSTIVSVGYDSTSQTLEIEFKREGLRNSVYQYFLVPPEIHSGLMAALSQGKYFDKYIKKGRYRYREIP